LDKPSILILVMLAGAPIYAASAPNHESSRLFRLVASQFEEPLIAASPTSRQEDETLFEAIQAYRKQPSQDNFRPFDAFL
jgi:hypothetical protein